MKQFKFDNFIISFSEETNHEIYDQEWVSGIIFFDDNGKYDCNHNKVDWNRLIINYKDGSCIDLPFHEGTFNFLPKGIEIERIK